MHVTAEPYNIYIVALMTEKAPDYYLGGGFGEIKAKTLFGQEFLDLT